MTADDYGYSRSYDGGILVAVEAGAVDSVSVMVDREGCDPAPLLAAGIETGLHLELDIEPRAHGGAAPGHGGRPDAGFMVEAPSHTELERAGPREREVAGTEIERQLGRFEELFGRAPAFLDGHHHAHARPGLGVVVAHIARARGLPVRSVDARQRRLLRCQGVPTPDHLVGRLLAAEPALPEVLRDGGEGLGAGVTEWMVHPGHADRRSGSSYDAARERDLELILEFRVASGVIRRSHRALGQ